MAGGSTPRKCAWPSGKPIRPPPGAGVAHTGRPAFSASATAASQAPQASRSPPATMTGLAAASMRAASAATASGSAPAAPLTRRATVRAVSPASASAVQSSIGSDRNTGPAGGSEARWMPRAQRRRHVLRARRLVAPLDQRVRHAGGVAVGQVGLVGHLRPHLLAGGDQQRRLVGLGVEDRAHGVAHARRGVQVHVPDRARGLGEAVGHAHRHGLLQRQHVAEVLGEVGQHRQLGGPGVAEHGGHAVGAQQVEGGFADGRHGGQSFTRARRPGSVARPGPARA